MTCQFKRHEHRMYICDGDLRHEHTTKTTTNKAKTNTDYLGGNDIRVHKSIWSLVIPPVRFYVTLAWECFCLLTAHLCEFLGNVSLEPDLFRLLYMVMLCNCLPLISHCVTIFIDWNDIYFCRSDLMNII